MNLKFWNKGDKKISEGKIEVLKDVIELRPIGIVDKNEKMIYEGDIVTGSVQYKSQPQSYTAEVKYNNMKAAFEFVYGDFTVDFTQYVKRYNDGVVRLETFEIVNNIYEIDQKELQSIRRK